MECKQKGYLQRAKKAPYQNKRGFFAGTVTDRVVRDWLQDDPTNNPGVMADMVSGVIDREWKQIKDDGEIIAWKDKDDRNRIEQECIEAVTKIEPLLNEFVVPFEYKADYKFESVLTAPHPNGGTGDITLNGYMDIVVRDDKGRWWVLDVKHTKDDQYWRKTVGQLSFYDLALFIKVGKPTYRTGLLQPLCKEPFFKFEVDEQRRTELLQNVMGMARDLWLEDFAPRTDTTECTYCEVKHACIKFQPVKDGKTKRMSLLGGLSDLDGVSDL